MGRTVGNCSEAVFKPRRHSVFHAYLCMWVILVFHFSQPRKMVVARLFSRQSLSLLTHRQTASFKFNLSVENFIQPPSSDLKDWPWSRKGFPCPPPPRPPPHFHPGEGELSLWQVRIFLTFGIIICWLRLNSTTTGVYSTGPPPIPPFSFNYSG